MPPPMPIGNTLVISIAAAATMFFGVQGFKHNSDRYLVSSVALGFFTTIFATASLALLGCADGSMDFPDYFKSHLHTYCQPCISEEELAELLFHGCLTNNFKQKSFKDKRDMDETDMSYASNSSICPTI